MATIDGVKPELEVPLIELTTGRVAGSVVLGLVVGARSVSPNQLD